MGTLYIVSTPIGNIQDITLRAVNLLGNVDIIACEDTRKTGLFLKRLKIPRRAQLISYYEENELKRIPEIIKFLKDNKNVALVSNAGTPTISDPGYKLVKECISSGIKVSPLPGSSAILAALVVSGLPTDKFLFLGYLPKKSGKRKKLLKDCKKILFSYTLIIFESPYRIIKLLNEIKEIFGETEIVICNELTKMFEKIIRGKPDKIIKTFQKNPLKGEITLLLKPPPFSDPGSN